MCKYFRVRLRTLGHVILVAAVCSFTGLYMWHRQSQSVIARVRIDPAALAAIDQISLEPPLREFIKLLENPRKVIGRPTTDFAELFALSFKVKNGDPVDWYEFLIASTPEQRRRLSRYDGEVPCWPMMRIKVDTKSQTIRSVYIYDQCL